MYLDANFFIHLHTDAAPQGASARGLLQRIIGGEMAFTSALTIDEVMWVLRKLGRASEIRGVVEETYATINIEILDVTADIPRRALDLMEQHNLRPRDAFHLAVMRKHGIKRIVTTDVDFDNIPGVKRVALV